MKTFVPKNKGPAVIKAANSNNISDTYRDSLTISYSFIGNTVPEISFSIGSRKSASPIMAGPVGGIDRVDGGSIADYANAVKEAGCIYWSPFHDKEAWTAVLKAGIPAVRVIKPLADNNRLLEEIQFDTENGAAAYAMDISHGMTVYGEMDGQQEAFASKTVEDLKLLNDASSLPFFLKDVQSVRDASLASEIGVAGIVLSGHNNRFPCSVPPLMLLPMIRSAVGDKLKIFVDGGINNGYDAYKALALGADGVLCARGLLAAYGKGGADAVTEKLLEMTAELKGAMANTGSPDLAHINRDCIIALAPEYHITLRE